MASAWGYSWGQSWGDAWGPTGAPVVVAVPQGGAPVPYASRRTRRKRGPQAVIAQQDAITEAAIALADAAAPITDPRAQEALDDDEILLLTLTRILH